MNVLYSFGGTIALFAFAVVTVQGQTPTPQPPSQSPVIRAMRLKLSAGDLPSAESILEEHRAANGEDTVYLLGLSWLARGAALVGDWPSALRYGDATAEMCRKRLRSPEDFAHDSDAVYALGSSIEARAYERNAKRGRQAAVEFLDGQLEELRAAPVALRSRIYKARDRIALVEELAPAVEPEDFATGAKMEWAHLNGRPIVLFVFAPWCGDCKSVAPVVIEAWKKQRASGVQFVAVTRAYETDTAAEKAKTAEVWRTIYAGLEDVPVVISTQAMLRYGGSSTPTFVFIDRKGIVRNYLPVRLTAERLASEIAKLMD